LNLLLVTRLYSGLENSIEKGSWKPEGIPTIYKLIERLSQNKNIDLDLIFTAKGNSKQKFKTFKFPELDANVLVIPSLNFTIFGKGKSTINQCFQFIVIIFFKVLRNNYDLIYSDRSNIVAAAFCANVLKRKVILRLLGAYPDMKEMATNGRDLSIFEKIQKKSYKANFEHIICTQDGSGGELFIEKACNPNCSHEFLVNGIDSANLDENTLQAIKNQLQLESEIPVLLFVGKLIKTKGVHYFIEAIIELSKHKKDFVALVIGDGPLKSRLIKSITENHIQEKIHLLGLVDHDKIAPYYQLADIYVSVNFPGGLSNTTLEAMKNGCCIVRLNPSLSEHIDTHTEKLLPSRLNIQFDRNKPVEDLVNKLDYLLSNPQEIENYASKVREHADQKIWCWDDRINYEVDKLIELCNHS